VRGLLGALGLVVVTLLATSLPQSAVRASTHRSSSSWSQRDCAVYVVSTMNLLRARNGRSVTSLLTQKLAVTRFEVYADQQVADLYFIELKRDDGSTAAALAYQMGWTVPMSVSHSLDRFPIRHAPASSYSAFRDDDTQLIGTFTSTIPS
jgi:hypothetical protein